MDRIGKMERMFNPRSIAFVGASNNLGKWGGIILRNLMKGGYEGRIYPVNPRESEIRSLPVFARVADIPGEVDLAIFTVPAKAMPEALRDCVNKGVPAGIVISAGFAELGDEGKALQRELTSIARAGGMVLVGPNGQGISVPSSRLHPWMPMLRPMAGAIGIASQSGNVSTMLAEKLNEFGFGCSKVISAGNCADLDFDDYLDYFRQDPETKVALLYIEGIGRPFLEAAARCSREKPVVIIKSGRSEAGVRAAATHTGVLAGSDKIFDAACRQAGLLRAASLEEAAVMAAALVKTPPSPGPRVGVITGGGGFGVLAADAIMGHGLEVPPLSAATATRLKTMLPPWWAPNNPVDMVAGLGYAGPREIIPVLMEADEIDAVMVLGIGWMYSMIDPANQQTDFQNPAPRLAEYIKRDIEYSQTLADYFYKWGKPLLLTSSLAHLAIRRGYPSLKPLLQQGIMVYTSTDDAVLAMKALYLRGKRRQTGHGEKP